MKIISFKNIVDLNISIKTCYEWAVNVIKNKEQIILPPKISMKTEPGVFCNVMPSIVDTESGKKGGVKMITRYPDCNPSLTSQIILYDADNGERLALVDGTWITSMRTGAVAANSIKEFANEGFDCIGVMGLGNVSVATLLFLAFLYPEKVFDVKLLKYKGQECRFIERFKSFPNFKFRVVDDCCSLVKGSQVVISGVTYAAHDFCDDSCFDEGVLVVPIHTLGFKNCDLFFDKIYGDDYGHIKDFDNFANFKFFSEVSDVLNGRKPGRENEKERIIVYNVGIAAHDIYYAWKIYKQCLDTRDKFENLVDVEIINPEDGFWL